MSSDSTTPDSLIRSRSNSSSSERTCTHSETSSVVWEHEPFEKFSGRVPPLFERVLTPPNGHVSVERLEGGSFNRVIGVSITIDEDATNPVREYVLRIPRYLGANLDEDLAPLELLRQRSKIRVPEVVAYDLTNSNVLEEPYMIQKRIPGVSLRAIYHDLPFDVRCAVAKEVGEVFFELHSLRSVTAGKLILCPSHNSVVIQPFHTLEYDLPPWEKRPPILDSSNMLLDTLELYENGPPKLATSKMILDTLEQKKNLAEATGPHNIFRVNFYAALITIATEMNEMGLFDDCFYCLCHLDLEPYNILVDPSSPVHQRAITGILDWDSAVFGPCFMSCAPPMWLWTQWDDDDDEETSEGFDESLANDIPATPQLCELKRLFEEAAGPTYKQFAYGAQYRLARRFMQLVLQGHYSNDTAREWKSVIADWGEVREGMILEKLEILFATG